MMPGLDIASRVLEKLLDPQAGTRAHGSRWDESPGAGSGGRASQYRSSLAALPTTWTMSPAGAPQTSSAKAKQAAVRSVLAGGRRGAAGGPVLTGLTPRARQQLTAAAESDDLDWLAATSADLEELYPAYAERLQRTLASF